MPVLIVSGVLYYAHLRSRSPEIVAGMGRVWENATATGEPTTEPGPELGEPAVA